MIDNQKEFEKEYKESVKFEAEYIIEDLKRTAENNNYEVNIFIRHVINELNRLNNQ